jgi:hypothetical protein
MVEYLQKAQPAFETSKSTKPMKTNISVWATASTIVLAAGLFETTAQADSINGSILAAPASVNLNLSTAYAFYGVSGSFVPATDPSNLGNFSTLTASGEFTGTGNDSVFNQLTYNNGTTSATLSPNYSLAQIRAFDAGVGTVTFTTTLLAANEQVQVYLSCYDTAPDFQASVGSASFSMTDVILPTTADGNGTGEGHTYGILDLQVSGSVGETLTIEGLTDPTGVTGGNGYDTVGVNGATVNPVPEPGVGSICLCGVASLLAYRRFPGRKG